MPDDNDRTEGRSISLPRYYWDHLGLLARRDGKTLSAYLRTVILDGLESAGSPLPEPEEVES